MKLGSSIVNILERRHTDGGFGPFEAPVRAELFSQERLEQHAASLAKAQAIAHKPGLKRTLVRRMAENEKVLFECFDAIARATRERRSITPAAEWLLDNFRVIEDQFKQTRRELASATYRKLPRLAEGPLRGHPRIYGVAWAFVAHTDSRFDAALLRSFMLAYQRVQPLTIAELWALPLALRCVLIENLRRICVYVAGSQHIRQQADELADDLLALDKQASTGSMDDVLRERVSQPLQPAFAVQLIQRLRYQDVSLQWLSRELARSHLTVDGVVQAEHAGQAAANMTVRNIITGMRDMWAFDWQSLFESVSLVDASLRRGAGYADMDFITRDRYRHAVEVLAARSPLTELEVAEAAMARAAAEGTEHQDPRHGDPGYYLISSGRDSFEHEIGFQPSLKQRCMKIYAAHASIYIGLILLLSALLLAVPLCLSAAAGADAPALWLLGLLGFFPASDLAALLVDKAVMRLIAPHHLARLELRHGIPKRLRSFVVMPTLLTSEADIRSQIDHLEVHYLANPDGEVYYGLLSDWADADTEVRESDVPLLEAASRLIGELNRRHGRMPDGSLRFHLYHRRRLWNAAQGKWLSWERKRGKLHEFNRLLRGAADTSFLTRDGKPAWVPEGVRYVITLDSDTRLPIGAVRQLVGAAAHPLNRPGIDPDTQRVTEGYGILQPRVTPTLPSTRESSIFQRLFSGPCGLDPYAAAVSNVYQDLFQEGSYTGKGIYDVDAFETALAGRIPENAILSHDLFEGIFARCGLVTDVEFFEDFPSNYQVAAARGHRWMRGDWQLLPWILGLRGDTIPAIGRWKMLDNLRRSLSAPATVALLLASWLLPHAAPAAWAAAVMLVLAAPAILSVCHGLLPTRSGVSALSHLHAVAYDLLQGCAYVAIAVTLLAHKGWLALDAIGRTLFRLMVSHRLLLDWVTSAQSRLRASLSLMHFTWSLRAAVLIAVAGAIAVWRNDPLNLRVAAPFLVLWGLSPFFAHLISLPPESAKPRPATPEEIPALREAARRIWRYFSTFVSAEDHALPPDNFQEDPQPVIAHRSSPTNFGLYLLSIVTARDFGWIGLAETIDRLEATLGTLQQLPRFRGHFYNWYDTRDLSILEPQYISSVDSGNLAGHLLALASACTELAGKPVFDARHLQGIADSVRLMRRAMPEERNDRRTLTVNPSQLHEGLDEFERALLAYTTTHVADWPALWRELDERAAILLDLAQTNAEERGDSEQSEALAWARAIRSDVASHLRDIPMQEQALQQSQPLQQQYAADADAHVGAGAAADPVQEPATGARDAACARLEALAALSLRLFRAMDFGFLYDADRRLFSIGYRVKDAMLDNSYYDLLASEARLASYVAVAKGDVPPTHWLRLGRPMTRQGWGAVLLSWSGSMFEYLMPSLVMYTPSHSLLDQTCRLAIARQIEYGKELGIPWGISESAYNVRDRSLTYQYSDFGVPGLGLKRGLGQQLVTAPYATVLAAMYQTAAAVQNLARIEAAGGRGIYGYYDAVDFTPSRVPEGQHAAPVRAYMAHHQGMSLVALGNVLFDGAMRHRFHRQAIVRAADMLLQEPRPREVSVALPRRDPAVAVLSKETIMPVSRRFRSARQPVPATHLLSNGRYTVMITAAGSGYSMCDGMAVTRWREDSTCDAWGNYLFLRDTASGAVWSATQQPVGVEPERYEVVFSEDRARISRQDGALSTTLDVLVSPEDNAEIRRLSITNSDQQAHDVELTSYAEVVLAPMAADAAHPAFSNLFIETEYLPNIRGLVAMRRPRSASDPQQWAAHILAGGAQLESVGYETDRARFLGRGRSVRTPVAILDGRPLSNTVGSVLDPIFSLRTRVRVEPGATAHVLFATMTAQSREELVNLADKYHDPASFERISTLAWTEGQVRLHHLGIDADEAHLFQLLANRVLYMDASLRPGSEVLKRNTLNATSLWRYSISGDLPIVLLRVDEQEDREIVRQMLRAHEYWHGKGLSVDLVILNERKASYIQDLQTSLETMVRDSQSAPADSGRGGIFVLRSDRMELAEIDLLQCAARAVLAGQKQGSLEEQLARLKRRPTKPTPAALPHRRGSEASHAATAEALPELEFFNGLGGFAEHGREYTVVLGQGQRTPAPWINVVANPGFGFLASESGSGYTWAGNSQENQLTPWSNDPVSDAPGEVFYLRDEDSGACWTPTALPIRLEQARYIARHGHGYTRYTHTSNGIAAELLQFVARQDPVKISVLTLENRSTHTRRLSATAYVEWVLGTSRAAGAPFIVTEMDADSGTLYAHNPWNMQFGGHTAFVHWTAELDSWTADRGEFIGRNGNLESPAALARSAKLGGRSGAGLDPCAALRTGVQIRPGQQLRLVFVLGQADDRQSAATLAARYRDIDPDALLGEITQQWDRILGTVQVQTPDRAADLMLNGWLLYQVLACRMWARAAFYQVSGAYGFRDQLQDSMALNLARPDLARAHILRSAARQFPEGDVQHWWHPPGGSGVRTHISDDRLWLPYVVAEYVATTGDAGVLDEQIPFLEGAAVEPGHDDAYYQPAVSAQTASLYEHCVRAIECSLARGAHGLPLMGTGDWNDGMNRVGHEGKGESVWLGWFLHTTLSSFSPLAAARGEHDTVQRWKHYATELRAAIRKEAWDGAWYRRAYFDDGTPLGTSADNECRIDSLAQTWSVISGAAEASRQRRAMQSVEEYLIRQGDDLVLLLAPAFDKMQRDPGYIKGYLPGVRENGGQYTHAAAWCLIAYTLLGDGNRAGDLFRMLNPIHHASSRAGVHAYKVEPYVVAGDIYAAPAHVRRGGWTWYTGSAGWLYRAGTEWLLGLRKRGETLQIDPCIPADWRNLRLQYRHGASLYTIEIENPQGVCRGVAQIEFDGAPLPHGKKRAIPLVDDGRPHNAKVVLGETARPVAESD
ncbi:GH36-type glycosyl hydrolase domain-containing protein [Candidimonas nitroreducens]|uniref:Phosphorylase n=1 Tax=Candidimonas nitroreducens TaxID=683354 RepID=A0A225N2S9_9BURK|nr:glucoamylase family protein [Candidimonas nitroreducens]OWT66430.1 phosphorylase [Candidimonas nitroreducens]